MTSLGQLRDAEFDSKEAIIDQLSQSGHPNVRVVLTALLEDRLYYRNSDMKVFMVKSADESLPAFDLIDPVSLKGAGSDTTDDLTKIGTNNHLRRVLKETVARFGLSDPDAAVRLAAVQDIEQNLDDANVALLRARIGTETDSRVKNEIATGAGAGWRRRFQTHKARLGMPLRRCAPPASGRMCKISWKVWRNLLTTRKCGRRRRLR